MTIKLNDKTKEFYEKLRVEGKISYLNKSHHIEAIERMNKAMEKVKRDYIIKNFNSEKSAENRYLDSSA